ncbi:MAG: DEAD/DEAH box helicase family protein [Clostridia bacterium]|nr:DEAD/DEAH box helicase family protein [Clostridia bacterium]
MSTMKALERFYKDYRRSVIEESYKKLKQTPKKKGYWGKSDLVFEVRMKNGKLAARLAGVKIIREHVLILTGFYFENYSAEKNCVWTDNNGNIMRFFHEGTNFLRNFGVRIKLDIDPGECRKIVGMLINRHKKEESEIVNELCENFAMLEKYDWGTFLRKTKEGRVKAIEDEHIKAVTSMDLPMDWENVFQDSPIVEGVRANSIPDALVLSVVNLGRVDIEYIACITNESCKAVINALRGSIYQNPDSWDECFYKGWETAEEYLSGRVRHKLKRARRANEKYRGYFEKNVKALEAVMPDMLHSDEIYVTLGSPWVPTDIIDKFIEHLFGRIEYQRCINAAVKDQYCVHHDEITGTWDVPCKTRYNNVAVNATYGTPYMNGLEILERTLNLKSAAVYRTVKTSTTKSGTKRVLDKDATVVVQEKQQAMIAEFKKWVWQDDARSARLEEIFDEKYGSNIVRHFDGSFLTFPGMSEKERLFDYQKNAVARILFTPNTLLAHDVGSGKTYIMAAAGMELRRMGISPKNLYVVPNNIIGQWKDMFLKLYPEANLLCVEPKTFTKDKREALLRHIRDNDYDAVIMAYSCFSMVPVSQDFYREMLKSELEEIHSLRKKGMKKCTTGLQRKEVRIRKKLKELEAEIKDAVERVYFEDLGITTLFVDEAHNFKNLNLETSCENISGISSAGSAKCRDMLDKVRCVQKANNGRGVVMATGTPITNSLSDIYVVQKYLQSGDLALLDLQTFDGWIGMFAEMRTEFEIDVDTTRYRMVTRFSKFHNIPELANLLSAVADFHKTDKENGIPICDGYEDIVVEKTKLFGEYLAEISKRASDVRSGKVKRTEDNMLKITTDGRKAALDMRLVDEKCAFTCQSKAYMCAENIFDVYQKTTDKKSAQIVFCDTSTPKSSFNMYHELKRILVEMGVAENEIAFIHDAESESEKRKLFKRVQTGEVRVIIGSTFKLGTGVNVQERLVALHHLDVPWRPSDMIQREGRILRQGNTNSKVWLYRYITKGSFDAYSWQLLENKQKMIVAILSGCANERNCSDVDDTVLNYAEVKALAIGNELIKKRVEVANALSRNKLLQRQYVSMHQYMEAELMKMPARLERLEEEIEKNTRDMEFYLSQDKEYTLEERREMRDIIYKGVMNNLLMDEEREICTYKGFRVVLPKNMLTNGEFVYLCAEGKYYVEMGTAKMGMLERIDNFLKSFEKRIEKLEREKADLIKREADMKTELKKEGYSDIIEELEKELNAIDKELGVGIDE